ncbi:MAG: TRAP transporter small permease [Desulfovibrionaceae bacterium]|nr:TRAP transporter small permease [Desulfovibrionaceae bacterium]
MLKRAVLAFFDHFESYICQVLLVFFVCIIFMQTILRATGHSLQWTEEIARYAFLWFILFGACYATRLAALNRITMHFSKFSPTVRTSLLLSGDLLWLIFCLIMAWHGYLAVLDLAEFPYHTPALGWDLSRVYLIFPISFTLMAIRIIQVNVIKYILKREIADPDQQALEENKHALTDEGQQG